MKSIAVILLIGSVISYSMAWPQRDNGTLFDKTYPPLSSGDEESCECHEANILSCVIAEIDQVEEGLVCIVMADHSQIFIPFSQKEILKCLHEVNNLNGALGSQVDEETAGAIFFEITPDSHGKYIDLSAIFDQESHGQIELRSANNKVILTLPFFHTVNLNERINISSLRKGTYELILRIGEDTWEKQLSI